MTGYDQFFSTFLFSIFRMTELEPVENWTELQKGFGFFRFFSGQVQFSSWLCDWTLKHYFVLCFFFAFNNIFSFVWYHHLAKLNLLHLLRIFSDFRNFSPFHPKQYSANISCLSIFGIMVHVWPWSHEFSSFFTDSLGFLLHVQILLCHEKWKSMKGAHPLYKYINIW